jgi:CheY-like chemotaxis protein
MLNAWQLICSFLAAIPGRLWAPNATARTDTVSLRRMHIVALVADYQERKVISAASFEESWAVQFAESSDDAREVSNRLLAPVILCDRDWPDMDWRAAVRSLASLPHRPCVILTSRVFDDYLWAELVRHGGYDLLAKPLRQSDVARVVRLAVTYWRRMAKAIPVESKTLYGSRS